MRPSIVQGRRVVVEVAEGSRGREDEGGARTGGRIALPGRGEDGFAVLEVELGRGRGLPVASRGATEDVGEALLCGRGGQRALGGVAGGGHYKERRARLMV